ncbi:hypothetical protein ACFQWA_28010 [Streptomyces thermogriseus]|uniref:Uncharacterized protein n=1 Tax=Streptomyces thermogriseus TaxID=75292 RepID=A0ABN1T194_9ACTN
MTLHRAVACDTDGCAALYVADPRLGVDAVLHAADRAGWRISSGGITTLCPSCAQGSLPVLERGDCPRCCGSTFTSQNGDQCRYCGHLIPRPSRGWEEEQDTGDGAVGLLPVLPRPGSPEAGERPA